MFPPGLVGEGVAREPGRRADCSPSSSGCSWALADARRMVLRHSHWCCSRRSGPYRTGACDRARSVRRARATAGRPADLMGPGAVLVRQSLGPAPSLHAGPCDHRLVPTEFSTRPLVLRRRRCPLVGPVWLGRHLRHARRRGPPQRGHGRPWHLAYSPLRPASHAAHWGAHRLVAHGAVPHGGAELERARDRCGICCMVRRSLRADTSRRAVCPRGLDGDGSDLARTESADESPRRCEHRGRPRFLVGWRYFGSGSTRASVRCGSPSLLPSRPPPSSCSSTVRRNSSALRHPTPPVCFPTCGRTFGSPRFGSGSASAILACSLSRRRRGLSACGRHFWRR